MVVSFTNNWYSKAISRTTSRTTPKRTMAYMNKQHINAFLAELNVYLKANSMPTIDVLGNLGEMDDTDYVDNIMEKCGDFAHEYVEDKLTDKQVQNDIILEYGFKKLIDDMCEYNGDEICEELVELDKHMKGWLYMLLMKVANLY